MARQRGYTDADFQTIRDMTAEGYTSEEIGCAMGRTAVSVRQGRRRLREREGSIPDPVWEQVVITPRQAQAFAVALAGRRFEDHSAASLRHAQARPIYAPIQDPWRTGRLP